VGLFKKDRRSNLEPQARYVVRQPGKDSQRYSVYNMRFPTKGQYWVVFDAQTGEHVFKVKGHAFEEDVKDQATKKAAILNQELKATNPYIFDCLTGARVWDDPVLENVLDRCAALNEADQETRRMGAEGRWQPIAMAQIRAQLLRHPSPWHIRDTGFSIEVRADDGEIVAVCATYPDAASIQSLAEVAMSDAHGFAPKTKAELDRPIRQLRPNSS
jgi:hypothetical protein